MVARKTYARWKQAASSGLGSHEDPGRERGLDEQQQQEDPPVNTV
jgi:hypothetical protein